MSQIIPLKDLEIFLSKANITIEKFKTAQAILSEMPDLAREGFNIPSLGNYAATIEGSLDRVIYRVNSNFFTRVKTDKMIPYCINLFHDALHNQLDVDQCQYINSLILNNVNDVDVLKHVLSANCLNSDVFKSIMRVNAGYNRHNLSGEGFTTDLIFVASKITGHDININDIKKSLQYLSKGDGIDFDAGVSVSVALNGNLTIKMDKKLVAQLNAIIKPHAEQVA